MKIASSECFYQSSSAKLVEASFEIVHMVAKEKRPHNIGETVIKLCIFKAAGQVLREKRVKISLLDFIIKTRINEPAKNIECKVFKKLQASPFFNSM